VRTKITRIDKDAVPCILRTGRPAGFWLCRMGVVPMYWYGIVADGERAEVQVGQLGAVLRFLHERGGV